MESQNLVRTWSGDPIIKVLKFQEIGEFLADLANRAIFFQLILFWDWFWIIWFQNRHKALAFLTLNMNQCSGALRWISRNALRQLWLEHHSNIFVYFFGEIVGKISCIASLVMVWCQQVVHSFCFISNGPTSLFIRSVDYKPLLIKQNECNDGKPGIGIRQELRLLGDWIAEYFLGAFGITIFRAISVDSGKLCC